MPKGSPLNLNDKRFGRLTVIGFSYSKNNVRYHKCLCDCGNKTVVTTSKLTTGHTNSCGCLKNEAYNYKHGLRKHPLYRTWSNMKTRCYNPKTHNFKNYGGKGITVCDEWKNDFENFYKWAIKNGYIEGFSIERINNNIGYRSDNCRWIPKQLQGRNKIGNHKIQLGHSERCLSEWCLIFNLHYNTVENRINSLGWDPIKALTTPIKGGDANDEPISTPRESIK